MMEIEEEVRAKRASGELPADVEKELDQVFARFAPPGALDSDFDALVSRAERQSYIDLLAPNESARPGVPHIKRVVQKTVRWYLRYVVDQFSLFASSISRATRMLGERVEELEAASAPDELAPVVLGALRERALQWTSRIETVFTQTAKSTQGRVLVTTCGTGDLVHSLTQSGVDAYGIDAAAELIASGSTRGLDLRSNGEIEHLESLNAGALGGLVLSGFVDIALPRQQVKMANLAALVLEEGAKLALVVTDPLRWEMLDDVPTDLVGGKPLRPSSWTYLLNERGFKDIAVTPNEVGDGYLILATR